MDLLDIERNKLITERCNSLLKVADNCDVEYLQSIIDKSNDALNTYNKSELTVCNPTNVELGKWDSIVKNVVITYYYKPFYKIHESNIDYYLSKTHKKEFFVCCDNTLFCEKLIHRNILLSRKTKNKIKLNPLEKALKQSIKTEILKTFQEQNKELINKYI